MLEGGLFSFGHLDQGKSISIALPVLFFLICLGGLQKSGFHLDLIVMHLSQNGHFDLTNTELQI